MIFELIIDDWRWFDVLSIYCSYGYRAVYAFWNLTEVWIDQYSFEVKKSIYIESDSIALSKFKIDWFFFEIK